MQQGPLKDGVLQPQTLVHASFHRPIRSCESRNTEKQTLIKSC